MSASTSEAVAFKPVAALSSLYPALLFGGLGYWLYKKGGMVDQMKELKEALRGRDVAFRLIEHLFVSEVSLRAKLEMTESALQTERDEHAKLEQRIFALESENAQLAKRIEEMKMRADKKPSRAK